MLRALLILLVGFVPQGANAFAPALGTTYLFNYEASLDPELVTCGEFFAKVDEAFPSTSDEFAIRSTTEADCEESLAETEPTTNVYVHILLAAEDPAAVVELKRYMDASMAMDFWGTPVSYRVVRKIVQTIAIETGVLSVVDGRRQFARTHVEHIALTHDALGQAVDTLKAFKADLVRGNVKAVTTLLESISEFSYSVYILPHSNTIEVFVNSVAVGDGGDVFVFKNPRQFFRDCGIATGKNCSDEL